ncbi:MAG TPA: hypothetical protein VI997_02900 [Candidatus Thermoplasmatota archaeon]|nr:hypothetical protein [Candidatus Thermoplasmatota archaeon]
MFGRFLREGKLRRIERKLRILHARQRLLRERIEKAHKAADKGDPTAREKAKKLESDREALVHEVNDLARVEKEIKAELGR